jgi:protein ImuA
VCANKQGTKTVSISVKPARSVLAELRAVVSAPATPGAVAGPRVALGIEEIDNLMSGGLRGAGLHEVFSAGVGDEAAASGFAAGLAACATRERPRPVLWIDTGLSVAEDGMLWPPGLLDWGIGPDRLIRARPRSPQDAIRMADDALSVRALGAIVLEVRGLTPMLDLTIFRRLHLAAESRSVPCFLLRFGAEPGASPALTRWVVASRPSGADSRRLVGPSRLGLDLKRHRGGGLGSWCVEWSADVQSFVVPSRSGASAKPLPQPAVSAVFDRPDRPSLTAQAG